jgi:uncharacterized protein (TIGR02646 family)
MKLIVKNQSQACRLAIQNYIQDSRSRSEKAHYDGFQDKNGLRISLLEEQGYICAYCMERIYDSALYTKIEHWKSQESYETDGDFEGTLNYDNLLAVCDGKISKKQTKELNCDSQRSLKNSPLTIQPTDNRCVGQITYLRNGTIQCRNPAIEQDLNEHLHLNLPILRDNRKKILEDIQKLFEIHCKKKNQEQMEKKKKQIVKDFIARDKNGHFKPYCGIVAYIYRKYL